MFPFIKKIIIILFLFFTIGMGVVSAGSGKIDTHKSITGIVLEGTGSIDENGSEEDTQSSSGTSQKDDTKTGSGIPDKTDKENRRIKLQEKRDIIKTLDEGIIKYLQPRDKKSFREIRKNYPDLKDQKAALLVFRNSLAQRYESFDNKKNKVITDYYDGLFQEIDSQIAEIDSALAAGPESDKKNLFQSLIDSIFN